MADDYANGPILDFAPPLDDIDGPVSLFLDLDGVLAAIEPSPDRVVPVRERTERLVKLQQRLEGRMVILSGRAIADIDRITGGAVSLVAGVHGLEIRGSGDPLEGPETRASLRATVAEVHQFANLHPLLFVEDKNLAVAIHYRDTPSSERAVKAFADEIASRMGLARQSGHFVEEIRLPGANKGDALRAFMALPIFAETVPIMVGDDRTDEDGFEAAAGLGGFGIRVDPLGPTQARYRLDDVNQVAEWLDRYLAGKDGKSWGD